MRDLGRQFVELLRAKVKLVFCRLVETRGSTPQKAGAAMLILPGGDQVGTLGGGCVEAEVKRRALALLAEQTNEPRIATFDLDHDYGWDDGLICGGRMKVLLHPITSDRDRVFHEAWATYVADGIGFMHVVAFEPRESCSVGSAWLVAVDRPVISLLDAMPASIHQKMPDLAKRPRASAVEGVAYLPMLARCPLVIVGGGHVGQAVANMAHDLEFDVTVVDDRQEYVTAERFPTASSRVAGPIDKVLPSLEIRGDTYCLIVTRGHNHDEEALRLLCQRGARYVGLIGSRRKIRLIFDDLMAQGIPRDVLRNVYAPLGIDIGSQTVPEIAVSIAAELVSHRNRGMVPGRAPGVLDDET